MNTTTIQTTGGVLHQSDIDFINRCICEVFDCEFSQISDLQPLQKGLSNSVLSFKLNGGKYVFRYPGLGSEILIDRGRESIVQKQIEMLTTQVAQPKLAIKKIQEFLIPLPPLDEQKRIADKISAVLKTV